MTDRVKGLMVALKKDVRIDDVEELMKAIRQFRGVVAVKPSIANHEDWINRMQIQTELRGKLYDALED